MSLVVRELAVRNFRSYEEFRLEPSDNLTVLVGQNGIGKTNLIEALQILTTTQSFRKPQWNEVVRWEQEEAHLELGAEGEGRRLNVELTVRPTGRREFKVNGKVRRRLMDVAGIIPCVVFTPEDLRLVKGSAERRRSALDGIGGQLSPSYAQLSAEYDRVVRQRNALLRDETTSDQVLEPWTRALITNGAKFREARERLFHRIRPHFLEAYERIAGYGAVATYIPSHVRDGLSGEGRSAEEAIAEHVQSKRREELARMTTLAGPHRDEILFSVKGRDARVYASQGQQRTIALGWKLAEVAVVKEITGQPPLLLLDDVMSELDESRRQALTSVVGAVAQTVVTTTNIGYFGEDLLGRAKVVVLS